MNDTHFPDVDTSLGVALRVPIPQFRHNRNRVETCIFGQSGWDDFESLGERLEAVCLLALERLTVLRKFS